MPSSPALTDADGALLPAWDQISEVAMDIAQAVGLQAMAGGVAPHQDEDTLRTAIRDSRWTPHYRPHAG